MQHGDGDVAARGEEEEILFPQEIRRYLLGIVKYKWIVAALVAVAITSAVLYTQRLTPIYAASTSFMVDPRPPAVLGGAVREVVELGTAGYWSDKDAEYYKAQEVILRSRALMRMTVEQHELHQHPKIVDSELELSTEDAIEHAVAFLHARLSITPPEGNRLFRINVRHQDPALAAFLANAHGETYVKYSLNLRTAATENASVWLTRQLDVVEEALRSSETALYEYKREHDILSLSLEDRQNLVARNIDLFTEALTQTQIERMALATQREQLQSLRQRDILTSPLFDIAQDEVGGELRTQYRAAERALADLDGALGPQHPSYIAQKKTVEELRKELDLRAEVILESVDRRHDALVAAEKTYRAQVEEHKQQAFALGPKEVYFNRLKRKEASDEQQFNVVLDRLRAADLTGRLTTVNIRPLDSAEPPRTPVYPNMRRNVATAAAFAIVAGIAFSLLMVFLDRTVRSPQELEQCLRSPLLGVIPRIVPDGGLKVEPTPDLYVYDNPASNVAECCRSIRTNLLFAAARRKVQTMVVASAGPREGKTTTAMFLGTTMAQSGQRVLIVDSDMRRPRLHRTVGVSREHGLSTVIVGEGELDDALKSTAVPNLHLLPAGPTPPNPAELLMTDQFQQLLEQLRDRYDLVLLDSPPVLAVTDAVVMSRLADGVIIVVRADSTTRTAVTRAERQLRGVGANIAGSVLNELKPRGESYHNYYEYYSYPQADEVEA